MTPPKIPPISLGTTAKRTPVPYPKIYFLPTNWGTMPPMLFTLLVFSSALFFFRRLQLTHPVYVAYEYLVPGVDLQSSNIDYVFNYNPPEIATPRRTILILSNFAFKIGLDFGFPPNWEVYSLAIYTVLSICFTAYLEPRQRFIFS